MNEESIAQLLTKARTIAVVGCSPKQERDSNMVTGYLQKAGYRIIPVNPGCSEVLGERCYPDLQSIPAEIDLDIVNVFRRPEHVPPVVEEAIRRGAQAVWLQLGCANPAAEHRAVAAGLQVVSNRCIKVDHRDLL